MPKERMRTLVLAIDGDMADASKVMRERWTELCGMLDLGPSTDRRECPFCKQLAMLDATRCGYCWKSLPPHVGPPSSKGGSVTSS